MPASARAIKGEQWQRALWLLSEIQESRLHPTVISYNAGFTACERCGQWRQALSLLSELWESNLEPDKINYSAGFSAGKQWQWALALLSELRREEDRAQRHQPQRWYQCLR